MSQPAVAIAEVDIKVSSQDNTHNSNTASIQQDSDESTHRQITTTACSQAWQFHDSAITPSSSSSFKPTDSGSTESSHFLNPPSHSYHHHSTNNSTSANSSKSPLPTSPSQRSIEKAIAQKFASLGMPPQRSPLRTRLDQFLLNESPRIIFLSFWSLLQFLIFYFSFEIYNRSTHYSQARDKLGVTLGVARGSAAVINFDCGVILLSVCRNLISVLRSTFLNGVVPFDKNVLFHKTVAWSIVLFSAVHCAGHYVNYYRLEQAEQRENGEVKTSAQYMALFTGPGFTGHVLMLVLFLMVTSSVERVRRKGFEKFWYTHHLFILFFLTLMYHGAFCFIRADTPPYCKSSPTSYKFVLGSLFFYILERTIREFRARLPATSISKIVLHPSKVLEVQIKKPNNRQGDSSFFRTKAGQYIFLNCPDISAFEWHPFTITSAPEEDYVSVHIRIVGDWTTAFARRLGCSFDDEQQFWIEELRNRSMGGEMEMAGVDGGIASASSTAIATDSMAFGSGASLSGAKSRVNPSASTNSMQFYTPQDPPIITLPRVLLDGPYGSPSEDAFNYEIAVLVGAGIGVTPFASVLKHIWYSVMQPTKIITLRKVYFFWVCRDRDAFEWFQDLLIALEEQNLSDFLEIRSYLTGELGKEELDTVLMEARASAAAAAARHFRSKHYGGGGVHQGQAVEGEEGDLLTTPQVPLDGSGAFPMEVMLGEELNRSNETLSDARDRDAITGLRSPTYYGRPNFDKIFGELALAHPREHGQVGVFFCGPKPLGKTLHRCARKYKFEFHKGNHS